jgi:hypothetical protein
LLSGQAQQNALAERLAEQCSEHVAHLHAEHTAEVGGAATEVGAAPPLLAAESLWHFVRTECGLYLTDAEAEAVAAVIGSDFAADEPVDVGKFSQSISDALQEYHATRFVDILFSGLFSFVNLHPKRFAFIVFLFFLGFCSFPFTK